MAQRHWFLLSMLMVVVHGREKLQYKPLSIKEARGALKLLQAFYDDSLITAYVPSKQQCCGGYLYPRTRTSSFKCCGKGEYDAKNQVCCEDLVYAKEFGFECCGKQYYDTAGAICCQLEYGTNGLTESRSLVVPFLKNVPKRRQTCCGLRRLYDPETELCCPTEVDDGQFQNNLLGTTTIHRIVKKSSNMTICCNGKAFDKKPELCNEGQWYPKKWMQRRRKYYSKYGNKEFMRDDSFYGFGMKLCGTNLYNYVTHLCCEIVDEERKVLTILKRHTVADQCCGSDVYNPMYEMCCADKIYRTGENGRLLCCGSAVYDPETQWCCGSSSSSVMAASYDSENNACCGTGAMPYNTKRQVCCEGHLINTPKNSNDTQSWACCTSEETEQPSSLLYDENSQICCDGKIMDLPRNKHGLYKPGACCGMQVMRAGIQFCCGDKIFDSYVYDGLSCCGGTTVFNSSTHVCCGTGLVEKKSSGDTSCCGRLPYNSKAEICCVDSATAESYVEPRKSTTQSCCGKIPYEPSENWCCGLDVIHKEDLCCIGRDEENRAIFNSYCPATPTAECCGLQVFDPVSEICCNGTAIQFHNPNMKCCGSAAYYPPLQICCDGRIYNTDGNFNLECCGNKMMNVKRGICCGGFIKQTAEPEVARCCFPTG